METGIFDLLQYSSNDLTTENESKGPPAVKEARALRPRTRAATEARESTSLIASSLVIEFRRSEPSFYLNPRIRVVDPAYDSQFGRQLRQGTMPVHSVKNGKCPAIDYYRVALNSVFNKILL